ncbi:MAG TPA: L,D-transpeptidase [Pseudonocardia sp.]|nr:L,D-transpeptidase [Pseudonocardia sp.]
MARHAAPAPAPAPPRAAGPTERSSRWSTVFWAVSGVFAVLAAVVGVGVVAGEPRTVGPAAAPAAPPVEIDELPLSSTYTSVDAAPLDPAPDARTDGVVVHPVRETVVHDAPAGRPIARLEPTQFGDTWLPLLAERGDWVQVLLPSRPNGSTGWLPATDLDRATTPYRIEVHLGSRTLELFSGGELAGSWTVGIGKDSAPTPTGRTFLLGAFTDDAQDYSPVILPLGTHSPTHDTFGGGPGTVAIHTWPTEDVYGTASSDGCIRVPPDALERLAEVPLGTLVMIDEG